MANKYQKLNDYFSKATNSSITLTFEDIESILGFVLPDSARKHRAAWYEAGHFMPKAWVENGYNIDSLDFRGQTVVFKKQQESDDIHF